jgi:hypothetical protein
MTIDELAAECIKAINQKSLPGLEKSKACITLKLPETKGEPRCRKLGKGKSPMGEVVSREDKYDVVVFDAVDVLAWIVAVSGADIVIS